MLLFPDSSAAGSSVLSLRQASQGAAPGFPSPHDVHGVGIARRPGGGASPYGDPSASPGCVPQAGGCRPKGGTAALGLSSAHKWTHSGEAPADDGLPPGDFRFSIAEGGNVSRLREVGEPRPGRRGGGVRGKITHFTHGSRVRMRERVFAIKADAFQACWFVTMTSCPGPLTWANVEDKRRAWVKLLRRRFGCLRWFVVWRKERHRSGVPHLHGLVYWIDAPPRIDRFRRWNDVAWSSVVTADPFIRAKLRRSSCNVKLVRTQRGIGCYTSKYLSKCDHGIPDPAVEGRSWGIERRDMYARCVDVRTVRLSASEGRYVRRSLAKLVAQRKEAWFVQFSTSDKLERIRPLKPRELARVLDRPASSLEGFSSAANVLLQVEHWQRVLAAAKAAGVPCFVRSIKRRRGRGFFRRASIVKSVVDCSDGRRWVEHDIQVHSFASSLAFISSADADRLVRAAIANAPSADDAPLPWADDGVAPF